MSGACAGEDSDLSKQLERQLPGLRASDDVTSFAAFLEHLLQTGGPSLDGATSFQVRPYSARFVENKSATEQ